MDELKWLTFIEATLIYVRVEFHNNTYEGEYKYVKILNYGPLIVNCG